MKGIYLIERQEVFEKVYSKQTQAEIADLLDMSTGRVTKEMILCNPEFYADVDVVMSTWSCVRFNEDMLNIFKNLKFIFYGAGSIKGVVTETSWNRGVRITSAYGANGISVAHYTVGQVIFSLKCGWYYMVTYKEKKRKKQLEEEAVAKQKMPVMAAPGTYKSTVGIISLGLIGRTVVKLLEPFGFNILAYDPFITQETADKTGLPVKMCSLEDIFRLSDVVSLHTPLLLETVGMITGKHFELMKQSASFINTSRGAIIKENEMIAVLKQRNDIYAILDVTWPEPPAEDSPLYDMMNVVLTPHIAGSMGRECERMGDFMLEELKHYLKGEPLDWEIDRKRAATMA